MSDPTGSTVEAVEFWHRKCRDAEAENETLRAALNLALMHLEDPRTIAAVRAEAARDGAAT